MYHCYIHNWSSHDIGCPKCGTAITTHNYAEIILGKPASTYQIGFDAGVQWAIDQLERPSHTFSQMSPSEWLKKEWAESNERER